ncbi:putative dCTP pyrophosphatase 1-like [Capsicum annuum]|uniref:uncharacterized protein LOC107855431 isoform X1 n=2 Tax=Capsicum annuum TaxID=4072 RepID=UPI0007BF7A9B|nr:uncharacterized protein LOC107855431 isoform X1 [Capsicum annuum]XP_016555936.1 uncharacterized protein LOC107855431 isoform X1 [Capsicum annuum]XP_016555937.1 uncharacterized protein LOC107855431 isoform X1 [Capsicum annuum]XP_016555938.1 uncharacterized protein LOC107855431 isoform X1 [Capsicum annuum]KAF3625567.1 putative dCTP pyrophosphatase 1-like [Capsicum annuum]KAF3630609.1 putative dCTP pyrophosphatase 1-like [Capsicum annuum]
MQCTNYLPGFFYPRDHVVSLTGNSQSIPHGDIAYNSSRGFNLAFPPFMVDQSQEFVYQKEILRQTILKHEATFRYQVNELHRLYGRQRELMDEIKRRKLAEDHIQMQALGPNTFLSTLRSEIFEKTFWSSVNLTSIEPYQPRKEMLHECLISGADKTVQPGGDYLSGLDIANECKASSSKNDTSGMRVLDLELPAEKGTNNGDREPLQEENPATWTNFLISELRPQCSSKANLVASGDSSSAPSRCRGTILLFDLNEPVQPFESDGLNSAFESNNIREEIKDTDLDLSGVARAECSTLNKEGRDERNLKSFDEVASAGRALLPCNQPASLPLENVDKIHAETRTDKSLLLSSWREFTQIPVAVQELPCFNTDASFSKGTKSSVKKFNLNQGATATPASGSLTSCFMQHDASDNCTGEDIAAEKDDKFSDYTSSAKGMDWNLTPPTYLSDQSAPSSDISHLNLPKKNVQIHKKYEVLHSNMVPNSTPEYRKCSRDNHLVGARIDSKLSRANICIDLNSCIKEDLLSSSPSEAPESTAERVLEGPVSPENKECSPPRGDSQDINIRTSIHLPKGGHGESIEELDRVAADTLIFISSSVVHGYSKTAIGEPSEASSNCLGRLAEVASSLASSPENEVEQTMEVHCERNVLLSDCSRKKLNLRKGDIDDSLSHSKAAKETEKGITLCYQPRRGQARKTKDQKDLQIDVVPAVESLLHQVKETNIAPKSGPWKKKLSRTSSRGKRRPNVGERTMSSLLLQRTLDNKHGITGRFLKGWGVTRRRQTARRAKSYVSSTLFS